MKKNENIIFEIQYNSFDEKYRMALLKQNEITCYTYPMVVKNCYTEYITQLNRISEYLNISLIQLLKIYKKHNAFVEDKLRTLDFEMGYHAKFNNESDAQEVISEIESILMMKKLVE